MTHESNIDRRIADAIRRGERLFQSARMERLALRIEAAAAPDLHERRWNPQQASWWEITSGWANLLIPAGLTVILASAALLWSVRPEIPVTRAATAPVVILGAARTPGEAAIDYAVDQIVGAPGDHAQTGGKR